MSGRRRALVLAALALAVPLPALALTGGSGSGLAVSASLNGCGVAGGSIVCGIDASFSGVPDARYITASVTAPDGSVTDFGTVARGSSGSATLWVPYTGSGTYSVSASAWGIDDSGDAEVIETDDAELGGDDRIKEIGTGDGGGTRGGEVVVPGEEPATTEPEATTPEEPQLPPCEPAPPPVPPAEGTAPGEAPEDPAAAPDAASTESAPTTDATQTPGVDCAAPEAAAPPVP